MHKNKLAYVTCISKTGSRIRTICRQRDPLLACTTMERSILWNFNSEGINQAFFWPLFHLPPATEVSRNLSFRDFFLSFLASTWVFLKVYLVKSQKFEKKVSRNLSFWVILAWVMPSVWVFSDLSFSQTGQKKAWFYSDAAVAARRNMQCNTISLACQLCCIKIG